MSYNSKNKNGWVLVLLLLAGIVLGSFITELTQGMEGFKWLTYGSKEFGMKSPLKIDIGVLYFEFKLLIRITIASIIGIILALFIYKKI